MTTQWPVWLNTGTDRPSPTATRARALIAGLASLAALTGCGRAADAHAVVAAGHESPLMATAASIGQGDTLTSRMDRARILGDSTARVWLVMVSDFQCPYCKQFHDQTFDALRRDYVQTGKVRMAFINFPLPMHANAWPAAQAAMCAGLQGKFWPFHDALFSSQTTWSSRQPATPALDSVARAVGLDTAALDRCIASGQAKALIQADQDRAERAGVNATPTIIIGQTLIAGAQPINTYRRALDSALAAGK